MSSRFCGGKHFTSQMLQLFSYKLKKLKFKTFQPKIWQILIIPEWYSIKRIPLHTVGFQTFQIAPFLGYQKRLKVKYFVDPKQTVCLIDYRQRLSDLELLNTCSCCNLHLKEWSNVWWSTKEHQFKDITLKYYLNN